MRLTCVEANSSISHEDDLVCRGRIDQPRSSLAVLIEERRKVIADELIRPALMESLIVPQPILDVHGDGSKGAVVQVVIIPIEEELVVPEALTEI